MLGNKIRSIRKSQDLKLNDIAEKSGLSVSYISQLERDLVEPSLSSLKKIASALNTPVYLLIDDLESDNLLVRKEDRPTMLFSSSDTKFEIVSTRSSGDNFEPKMLMVEFFIPPETEDSENYVSHEADELILLLEGEVEIIYGESVYTLHEGDSMYIQQNVPHKIVNKSDKEAVGYYVVTPYNTPKSSQ